MPDAKEWEPPPRVKAETAECLVIRAGFWFMRPDFQEWRRRSGVATWGEAEIEGQDVFIVYADDELDWHTEGMPADIERKIMRLIKERGMEYGVVWIKAV